MTTDAEAKEEIKRDLARFIYDPYKFVKYAYPWGVKGTFLEDFDGPDAWQTELLNEVGHAMREDAKTGSPTRIARRSGHEIGKTTAISWLIQWFVSTREHCAGTVTANTKLQLEGKTWRELKKWHDVMIHNEWFSWFATKYCAVESPSTWGISAVPWTKERSQAFAGTHEKRGVLMVFDEASIIDDSIWEVADGAMDVGALWLAFGNPTENTGRFYESCVGRFRHRWRSQRVDSRTSKIANQTRIKQWIDDYGLESDYVKIRVLGEFPAAAAAQFIPSDIVFDAAGRHLPPDSYGHAPVIVGVDVARYGDDQTVIVTRQGMALTDIVKFRNKDTMWIASWLANMVHEKRPDALFVDATGGYGAGVVDRLRQTDIPCIEVQFAASPSSTREWANKRAEMWGRMKAWLKLGAAIPDDDELKADLVGPTYQFISRQGAEVVILESKDDMKSRGLASPDVADALACTFAEPVVSKHEMDMTPFVGVKPAVGYTGGRTKMDFIREARARLTNRGRR